MFGLFHQFILRFEAQNMLVRGAAGSERSAMIFGEYFPNPGIYGARAQAGSLVAPWQAALVEGAGTAMLVFVIFALVDRRNASLPTKHFAPVLIGATITVLIAIFAPLTQAGWNPARDFGPRIVAYFAGWKSIAIPGPSHGFWIYIVGPLIGAPLGGLFYDRVIRPGLMAEIPAGTEGADGGEDG